MLKKRRYDIDWIRVIVFDILIVYHVGMFFCPWEWHIKNNEIVHWLQYPMSFTSYWRIPILFVVSGMGTRFALSNRTGKFYVKERVSRLLIPLVFGMLVIIPPQVYFERLVQGMPFENYLAFYPHYFDGIYPKGNFSWHHLWFLPYLLLMSILATPLFLYLRQEGNVIIGVVDNFIKKNAIGLYLGVLPLLFIETLLADTFPISHALLGDWYALVYYSFFFLLGYILICVQSSFWNALAKITNLTLFIGIISFALITFFDVGEWLFKCLKVINTWSWILTIFGFAAKFLNKESELIKYRNKAVYPFYILHQTVTIICGYYLMNLNMHYALKMLIMIGITFGGSWLIYEGIILKIPFLQPLFGVKRNS